MMYDFEYVWFLMIFGVDNSITAHHRHTSALVLKTNCETKHST